MQVRKRDVVLSFGGSALGASVRVVQLDNGFPHQRVRGAGPCVRGLLHEPHGLGSVRERAQVVLDGGAARAAQLRRRRPPARLLRPRGEARARALHLLGGRRRRAAVGQGHRRRPRPAHVRRAGPPPRPALALRRPVPALRRQQRDAARPVLPRPPWQGRGRAHVPRGRAARPGRKLFVNDYNVECGNGPNATPERYLALIDELRRGGAQVGGIRLQGHVSNPVGEVICDALDKLATTDLPIWITELDVGEQDEGLRADDLEVVLREAYAHPAVEGVIFWGIMQGHMWRQDAALLNADGTVNEAGQRLLDLRREWLSDARGRIDAEGHFKFRGFHGTYIL